MLAAVRIAGILTFFCGTKFSTAESRFVALSEISAGVCIVCKEVAVTGGGPAFQAAVSAHALELCEKAVRAVGAALALLLLLLRTTKTTIAARTNSTPAMIAIIPHLGIVRL